MWTLTFWKRTLERGIKTAAQSVILAWGLGDGIANLFAMDFGVAGGAAAGGLILSVLTSIVSLPIGSGNDPSLVE